MLKKLLNLEVKIINMWKKENKKIIFINLNYYNKEARVKIMQIEFAIKKVN